MHPSPKSGPTDHCPGPLVHEKKRTTLTHIRSEVTSFKHVIQIPHGRREGGRVGVLGRQRQGIAARICAARGFRGSSRIDIVQLYAVMVELRVVQVDIRKEVEGGVVRK